MDLSAMLGAIDVNAIMEKVTDLLTKIDFQAILNKIIELVMGLIAKG